MGAVLELQSHKSQRWKCLVFSTSNKCVLSNQSTLGTDKKAFSLCWFLWICALLLMSRAVENWNGAAAKQLANASLTCQRHLICFCRWRKTSFKTHHHIHFTEFKTIYYCVLLCENNIVYSYTFTSVLGMDTLNSAIESLMASSSKEDWMPVTMNVADATVTVISERVRQTVIFKTCLTQVLKARNSWALEESVHFSWTSFTFFAFYFFAGLYHCFIKTVTTCVSFGFIYHSKHVLTNINDK